MSRQMRGRGGRSLGDQLGRGVRTALVASLLLLLAVLAVPAVDLAGARGAQQSVRSVPSLPPSPAAEQYGVRPLPPIAGALLDRYDCAVDGFQDGSTPRSALIRRSDGQFRVVSYDQGWRVFSRGSATAQLVAVCRAPAAR